MNRKINYISRIKDEFDFVLCGVNGVLLRGGTVVGSCIDTLIKMYQSGKKIALVSNTGMRVRDLYYFLKQRDIPMNIFYAMITAGEIAHFYLKNHKNLGKTYYNLSGCPSHAVDGLPYRMAESMVMADFVVAETSAEGVDMAEIFPVLEQALHLNLPMLCIGNNTSVVHEDGVRASVGAVAEKYALLGGKIIPFGKPDVRIASYLTENISGLQKKRCLVIGDCMSTDMRMGNAFGAQTLFLTNGVHLLVGDVAQQLTELADNYGLNIDYYAEELVW
ncbi:MAG: HAD hydrolase-like protein [Alphaproteobacteria bacterium]|nr:HAD hydrolase-like protein [Alphaproteobacteria bacterium]